MSKTKKSDRFHSQTQPESEPETPPTESARRILAQLFRSERTGWDFAGLLTIALTLLTLLGLFGLTRGLLIDRWVGMLSRAFGWGIYPLALMAGAFGVILLVSRRKDFPHFSLKKVLAIEGLLFSVMAILSQTGGSSLSRAESGLDGGTIGWGLANGLQRLLPGPLSMLLLILLCLVFLFLIFDLGERIEKALVAAAGLDRNPEGTAPGENEEGMETVPTVILDVQVDETEAVDLPKEEPSSAPLPTTRAPLSLLSNEQKVELDESVIRKNAYQIEKTLSEFGVPARVIGYRIGPAVTQYALEPGFVEKTGPDGETTRQKVRVSQISNLAKDLTRALAAERLRIEAPVPGHAYVGIEVPNMQTATVRLRPILESDTFSALSSPLAVALGRDVSGQPVVADLARMPHLLIAGTTGSGKSVCATSLAASLVMNNSPRELRLAMLDPKMVELVRFNGLPHLLGKVETNLERMLAVLRWALAEMDSRYRLLEAARARDLDSYNRKQQRRRQETLPRIVIIIDELADLMMSSPEQTEHSLVRLAQMARATGIHLVLSTQRPSTDVVTGLIKANFPSRIAFTVASSVDSRVILDTNGAETLLGKGDMLFLDPEVGSLQRAQGVLVSDQELERVISFWQAQAAASEPAAVPWEEFVTQVQMEDGSDSLLEEAIKVVQSAQRASTSLLQRRLRIGFPRAARLMDELEERGIIGPPLGSGKDREVLLDPDEEGRTDSGGEMGVSDN